MLFSGILQVCTFIKIVSSDCKEVKFFRCRYNGQYFKCFMIVNYPDFDSNISGKYNSSKVMNNRGGNHDRRSHHTSCWRFTSVLTTF